MRESQCEASVTQRKTIFSLFAKVDIFSLARTRMWHCCLARISGCFEHTVTATLHSRTRTST